MSIVQIFTKIQNLIRLSKTTLSNKDDKPYPYSQVTYNGKVANAMTVSPYGLYSQAPINSLALMFQMFGEEENLAAICFDPESRFKGLASGDVVVGNPLTGSYIKFPMTKELTITSASDLILNVTGNVTINCNNAQINAESVNIDGAFNVVGGNLSNLGDGGSAIARVGDTVLVNTTTGEGVITSGGQNTSI